MSNFSSFKDAFGALQRNASTLRAQQEPNIDELLPMVQESIDAYNVCKERINAVELALKEALSATDSGIRGNDDDLNVAMPSAPRPA